MTSPIRFEAIRSEGGILPVAVLQRIHAQDARQLAGLLPASYGAANAADLRERMSRSWGYLRGRWQGLRRVVETAPAGAELATATRQHWLLPLLEELGYGRVAASAGVEIEGKRYPVSHRWQGVPLHLCGWHSDLDRRGTQTASSPHGMLQELLNRDQALLWGALSNGRRLRLLRDDVRLTRKSLVEFDLEKIFDGDLFGEFCVLWLTCHASRLEPRAQATEPSEPREETPVSPSLVQQGWAADGEDAPEPGQGASFHATYLEQWRKAAEDQGTRVRDGLRDGVQAAICALGAGLLDGRNAGLRESLRAGTLAVDDYYRQVLRLAYRLIFLLVAEDRDLLHPPGTTAAARQRYASHYSTERLRRLAEGHKGSPVHADLWRGLVVVMRALDRQGAATLGLAPLGSELWREQGLQALTDAELPNRALLDAVRALCFLDEGGGRQRVDWRNLASEELGSVYESLLELHPRLDLEGWSFALTSAAGHERKTTGSYYTPDGLVQCLLESALDPVLERTTRDEAGRPKSAAAAEQALLALKVVDPACGSGHFLVGAAHRIAAKLASVRSEGQEPAPEAVRRALREVVGRCLYGVDINPMAVELCKVALWMEALEPGRPLSFLDRHIRAGNALLGASPALIEAGIPDAAFAGLEGDDKALLAAARKANRAEARLKGGVDYGTSHVPSARSGQGTLFAIGLFERGGDAAAPQPGDFAGRAGAIDALADASVADVERKAAAAAALEADSALRDARRVADAYCAAFVWRHQPDAPPPVTQAVLRQLEQAPASVAAGIVAEIDRVAVAHGFFHWPLAFPEVFAEGRGPRTALGWHGGFDVVLGNPPWERVKLQEREFFAPLRPAIAEASNAAVRKKMMAALASGDTGDRALLAAWHEASRAAEGQSALLRQSGRYPLCGRGDVNTYAVFAELAATLVGTAGYAGVIVPTGIATDDTTKHFFAALVDEGRLASLVDFENRQAIFLGVHRSYKFSLLTTRAPSPGRSATFAFFCQTFADARSPDRRFTLSAADIARINPNTRTAPIFRTRHDADLTRAIHERVPVLWREERGGEAESNPWGIRFAAMLHMANDSGLFHAADHPALRDASAIGNHRVLADGRRLVPLYEAKMVHHYDHRFGDYALRAEGSQSTALPDVPLASLQDPTYQPTPRYWVEQREVEARLAGKWERGWLLGWRRNARSTDERTLIATILPAVAVGDSEFLMLPEQDLAWALSCALTALVVDFCARQKVGGANMSFFIIRQLPVPTPADFRATCPWSPSETIAAWLRPRVLELTYTAWDLQPFAQDLGYDGPPFRWDADRRFQLRCELDAAFFHLYGLVEAEVEYVLGTFPIVARREVAEFGSYRSRLRILEAFRVYRDAVDHAAAQAPRAQAPSSTEVSVARPRLPTAGSNAAASLADIAVRRVIALVRARPGGLSEADLATAFAMLWDPAGPGAALSSDQQLAGRPWPASQADRPPAERLPTMVDTLAFLSSRQSLQRCVRNGCAWVDITDSTPDQVGAKYGSEAELALAALSAERQSAEAARPARQGELATSAAVTADALRREGRR